MELFLPNGNTIGRVNEWLAYTKSQPLLHQDSRGRHFDNSLKFYNVDPAIYRKELMARINDSKAPLGRYDDRVFMFHNYSSDEAKTLILMGCTRLICQLSKVTQLLITKAQ